MICASNCIAPLAPGYQILKESREVRFIPGATPELQIHSTYTLLNSGTTSLSFIDVIFPDEKLYGRKNLRVQLDGREITPAQLPEEYRQESPDALRIALDPPWERKQKRDLTIDYSFSSPADLGSRITLGPDNFHLGHRGWIPLPQPPKRVLAPYPARPPKMSYTVRVPENFLVLARGKLAARKKDGNEIVYRFDLGKDDLSPYVVAGRYLGFLMRPQVLQPSPSGLCSLSKTIPLPRHASARHGPLSNPLSARSIKISSSRTSSNPPNSARTATIEDAAAVASFPGGALVSPSALALGLQSDDSSKKSRTL